MAAEQAGSTKWTDYQPCAVARDLAIDEKYDIPDSANGESFTLISALLDECCTKCRDYSGADGAKCSTFSWSPSGTHDCYLKMGGRAAFDEAQPHTGFYSGFVGEA